MDFTVGQVDFAHTCLDGQVKISENYYYLFIFTILFSSGQVRFGVSRPHGQAGVNY